MERAFRRLKQAFTTVLVFVYFNPDKTICLEIDSLGFTIAGIMSQQVD
jgi:hypothetical protein